MANNYTIDFSDQNTNRNFQLNAYTTNGPKNPTSNDLDSKAASAATSLLLHGKGSPSYGERIQENFIHLLENFAGVEEPKYPVGGQMWMDKSSTPHLLRVYNTRKHIIIVNAPPNATNASVVTITGDETTRFSAGDRLRLIDVDGAGVSTDEQLEFLISVIGLDGNTNTTFSILPVPISPVIGWYVGGWEYLMQNNIGLIADLPANGFSITGIGSPVNAGDIVNKTYVDTQITLHNELDELTDVTLSAPTNGEILVYDGSVWRNQSSGSFSFLPLTGGSLSGQLDMGTNLIRSVANPISGQDAATKSYVDSVVTGSAGAIPTILDDLNDVLYGSVPGSNDILQFDGVMWTNVTAASFVSSINALLVTGGTMTGNLILNTNPTAGLQAATKNYVDLELAAAISSSGDGVVNGGFFDILNQELTLTRTNGLSSVVVAGFATGGTSANAVPHEIANPTTLQGMVNLYWEHAFYTNPTYPNITIDAFLTELNKTVGNLIDKPKRAVVSALGGAEYDVGDDISGTFGDLGYDYVPGYNNLIVYVNGVKQYADEHGFLEVNGTLGIINPATDTDQLWPGMPTGLNSALTYAFQIRLNSGTASDSGLQTVVVAGASAANIGSLIDVMNAYADANLNTFSGQSSDAIPPFNVTVSDSHLTFFSSFPGANSSVTLIDGDGGTNNPLFAAMSGGTDAGGRTYTYTIPTASINSGKKNDGVGTNPPAPSTWAYREVGRVGRASTKFVFTTGDEPPVNTPVEIMINNVPFYNRMPQP